MKVKDFFLTKLFKILLIVIIVLIVLLDVLLIYSMTVLQSIGSNSVFPLVLLIIFDLLFISSMIPCIKFFIQAKSAINSDHEIFTCKVVKLKRIALFFDRLIVEDEDKNEINITPIVIFRGYELLFHQKIEEVKVLKDNRGRYFLLKK